MHLCVVGLEIDVQLLDVAVMRLAPLHRAFEAFV